MTTASTRQGIDIHTALELAKSGESLDVERVRQVMENLERHECWNPLFRLINARLDKPSLRTWEDYIVLARCQLRHLEDVFAAAQTCARMIREIQPHYPEFRDRVLGRILDPEDWSSESVILQAVIGLLPEKSDQIACQERLCLLFEKKIPNDIQLAAAYEKLLALAPESTKALRYFKMVFAQEGDWNRVVQVLQVMLRNASHPQESFRIAQEIAATLLYQLDMPKESLAVLDEHCSDSPLDTSTIQFDAHHRQHDWNGCLNVLRQNLLNAESDSNRAALHFRSGEITEQIGNAPQAIEHYAKAASLLPNFLDPIEKIITLRLAQKDWSGLVQSITELRNATKDEAFRAGLAEAIQRVEEGMSHAR